MGTDEKTIDVYNEKAGEYQNAFSAARSDPAIIRFKSKLTPGATVLDLGCGPGTHAAALYDHGFQVIATDASAAMVKAAKTCPGISVVQAEFSDLNDRDFYDGVWANFSLLHERRDALPGHLSRIARALKAGGVFHLGMKTGSGERRDHLGRFYTFYTRSELRDYLNSAGFTVLDEITGESAGLAGTVDPWIEVQSRLIDR